MKNKGVTLMTKSLCQKAMLLCISIISKEFLVDFQHSYIVLILILHDNIGNSQCMKYYNDNALGIRFSMADM